MNASTHFSFQRRVEFADTDMARVVHFTSILRYIEEAEHAFLRSRGLSPVMHDERGYLGFPKIRVQCDYRRPAHFSDLLDVRLRVTCDGKSLAYDCEFWRDHERIADGQLITAYCRFKPDRPPYALPVPQHVVQAIATEPKHAAADTIAASQ